MLGLTKLIYHVVLFKVIRLEMIVFLPIVEILICYYFLFFSPLSHGNVEWTVCIHPHHDGGIMWHSRHHGAFASELGRDD